MLLLDGGTHLVVRSLDEGGVLLQNVETGECKRASEDRIFTAIFEGVLKTEQQRSRTPFDLSKTVIAGAEARGATELAIEVWSQQMAWLNALRAAGVSRFVDKPWIRLIIERLAKNELKDVRRFSIGTLYALDLTIRKADGDVTAGVPDYGARGGRGAFRGDARTLEVMQSVIKRVRDEETGPIVKRIIADTIRVEIDSLNASATDPPIPQSGESTVNRQIAKLIPAELICRRNHGPSAAKKSYRQNAHSRDSAVHPLEASEYDDTDSGVFIVDERTGLPWGRAYLTNGISQSTLLVLGYDLGDRPRSFDSAVNAICHSLLPKPDCKPGEIGYGCQGQILLDNARYNDCKAMKKQSTALRLLLSAARPYGPTEKSCIEHFNFEIKSSFCPTLPGWRGDRGSREAVKEGICSATMVMSEFSAAYFEWLKGVYANKPGEDGWTPKQRWLNRYERHGPAVRYSSSQLALFRLRPDTLTFRSSGGLLRLRLRYASHELELLQGRLGCEAEVQVFVDSKDLSYLMVLDPHGGNLLRVPCSEDPAYVRGLTETQQQMICAMAYERGRKNPSLKDLYDARRKLHELVEQSSHSNRLRQKSWARRVGAVSAAETGQLGSKEPPARSVVTELEYHVDELLSVELTADEQW